MNEIKNEEKNKQPVVNALREGLKENILQKKIHDEKGDIVDKDLKRINDTKFFINMLGNSLSDENYRGSEKSLKKDLKTYTLGDISATKRSSKIKDDMVAFIEFAAKNKLNTPDQIFQKLATDRGVKLTVEQSKLISEILKARVYNKVLNVNDLMKNKTLKIDFLIRFINTSTSFPCCFVTNDKLYLTSLVSFLLTRNNLNSLCGMIELKSVLVNTIGKYFNSETSIERGYMQDYMDNLSLINFDKLTKDQQEICSNIIKIAEDQKKYDQLLNENNMVFFSFKNDNKNYFSLIVVDGPNCGTSFVVEATQKMTDVENLKRFISAVKYVSFQKEWKDSIKIMKFKNEMLYCCSSSKTVDYMPCILRFPKTVPVSYYVTCELKLNDFSDYFVKLNQKFFEDKNNYDKDLLVPENIVDWDTISTYLTFLYMEMLTYEFPEEVKRKYIEIYKIYNANRTVYTKIFNLMNRITEYCVSFFTSFKTKINFDVVKKLNDKGLSLIESYENASMQSVWNEVINLLNYLRPATNVLYNAMVNGSKLIPTFKGIFTTCRAISMMLPDGMEERMRICAVSVYSLFIGMSENPEINIYITPSVFLGNTKGEFSNAHINEALIDLYDRQSVKILSKEETIEKYKEAVENAEDNLTLAIQNSIQFLGDEYEDAEAIRDDADYFVDMLHEEKYKPLLDRFNQQVIGYYADYGMVPVIENNLLRDYVILNGYKNLNFQLTQRQEDLRKERGKIKDPDSDEVDELIEKAFDNALNQKAIDLVAESQVSKINNERLKNVKKERRKTKRDDIMEKVKELNKKKKEKRKKEYQNPKYYQNPKARKKFIKREKKNRKKSSDSDEDNDIEVDIKTDEDKKDKKE